MTYQPHLIAPFKSGLVKYYKPWVIGEDSFPEISNAYTWRGSVRKREGYHLFASLPAADKPVQGLKNWINPANLTAFSIAYSLTKSYLYDSGSGLYVNITFLAKPAGTAFSWTNTATDYFYTSNFASSMWSTNNLTADHIRFWNGTAGAVGVSGGWSIHLPTVNGTTQLQASLLILPYKGRLVALNTTEGGNKFASRARWAQLGSPYTSNVAGIAITNIAVGNPTVVSVADTTGFTVGLPAGVTLVVGSVAALLNFNQFNVSAIVPGVSVTIDVDTTGLAYISGGILQGAGTTVPPTPFEISLFGWRDDIPGRGGYVDADTSERIIAAEIVKDVLVVFFQRSTWRLRYTGNEILPFIWERLNTQYGSESTSSTVAFDDSALAFSRFGWIGSSTTDVDRIDLSIPDNSFSVNATNLGLTGLEFVQGIRDFFRQFAYWTFPNQILQAVEDDANQIYTYNYIDKTWSIFTPSAGINVFGTYVEVGDKTWGSLSQATDTWSQFASVNDTWQLLGTVQNKGFPTILGGDDNGNVYAMFAFQNSDVDDADVNFSFSIFTKRMNPYFQQGRKARVGYVDIYCTTENGGEITLNHYVDDQEDPVLSKIVVTTDRSSVAISNIAPGVTTVITTSIAHGLVNGQQISIINVVGTLAPILNNNRYIVTVLSPTTFSITAVTTGYTYTGGGKIPLASQSNVGQFNYVRVYLGVDGYMHQFELTLSDEQKADPIIGKAQFELQGLVVWTQMTGRIKG